MAEKERKNRIYRAAAKLYLRTLSPDGGTKRDEWRTFNRKKEKEKSQNPQEISPPQCGQRKTACTLSERERHVCDLLLLLFAMLSS